MCSTSPRRMDWLLWGDLQCYEVFFLQLKFHLIRLACQSWKNWIQYSRFVKEKQSQVFLSLPCLIPSITLRMKFKILSLVFNMICQPWPYCHLGKDHSVLISNTLATICKKPSPWKRPWCWERFESRRRRGQQRTRWLDGIIDSMDMSVCKLQEMVKDREIWHATSTGSQRVGHNLAIQQQQHSVLWGCPGHRRMFISIPGPHPLDASSTPPLTVITRDVSRPCQRFPWGKNHPVENHLSTRI